MYNEIDDLLPENVDKIERRKKLFSEIQEMEEEMEREEKKKESSSSSAFLPSSFLDSRKKKKKKEVIFPDMNEWESTMEDLKMKETKRKKSRKHSPFSGLFGDEEDRKGKKKKGKKGKKEQEIDYRKEFEPELGMYKNLLQEQTRFTDSLQKEYDSIKSSKSSSRGINKNMTDLIERTTSARTLSMQLVEKIANTKKVIAELNMKQRKELGMDQDMENMGDFASSYLNTLINERKNFFKSNDNTDIIDYQEDGNDLYDDILEEQLSDTNRSSDVDTQLRYEKENVRIYVRIINNDIDNYEFVAINEDGDEISDYPLPLKTKISINRSTNIATDTYGRKYFIQWE